MTCYRGEYSGQQPAFAKDSPAAVSKDPVPVPVDAPEIQYSEEDNEAIRAFIRQTGSYLVLSWTQKWTLMFISQ